MKTMPLCCEVFAQILGLFDWMSLTEGDKDARLMPYVQMAQTKWRVNFCPSCGKDVRSVVINTDQLLLSRLLLEETQPV